MVEVNVRSVGHAHRATAVHAGFLDLGENSLLQAVPHRSHLLVVAAVQSLLRQLRGFAQAHNSRYVLGASPQRALVPTSIKQRVDLSSLLNVERSDTLRRMNLVAGNREGLATDSLHINRNFAECLHRVGVKVDTRFRRDGAYLFNRLQNSSLVVRHHNRDELGVRAQGATDIGRIDHAAAIHRQYCHFGANLFQMPTG